MKNSINKRLFLAVTAMLLACVMAAGSIGTTGAETIRETLSAITATGGVSASSSTPTSYTVTYTSADTTLSGLFADVEKTYTADISGCITLTGPAFTNVVTATSGYTGYDCETFVGADGRYYSFTGWHVVEQDKKIPAETVFQPGDVITPEALAKYASDGTLKLEALWGVVYFIQNKYNTMTYKKVTRDYYTLLNEQERVVAQGWAKADVIALDTNVSAQSGLTGAYDYKDGEANKGYTPGAPIATIDHLYECFNADDVDPLDAYGTVAMLTGNLNYIKSRGTSFSYPTEAQLQSKPDTFVAFGTQQNEYVDAEGYAWRPFQNRRFGETYNARAVTFKSSQAAGAGTKYAFYYKSYNDEGQFRGSVRFDNLTLQNPGTLSSGRYYFENDECGVITRLYDGDPYSNSNSYANMAEEEKQRYLEEHYFETTARLTAPQSNPITQLRANAAERVVLNGGVIETLSHSWGDNETGSVLHAYYVGRNASVSNIYGGATDSNGTKVYTFPFDVIVTGGTITRISTTSVSGVGQASCSGDRTVRIYGGTGHQPDVGTIYAGGYGSPLTGNVDLLIKGCTNIEHVCGGGWQYTSDVTGNINVRIEDSAISGTVYGGGLYGDVFGEVTLSITRSTVKGAIYGSGQGNVNTVNFNTTEPQGYTNMPTWWDTPQTGFSTINEETGVITQYKTHQLGRRSGVGKGSSSVIWMIYTREVYLSVAQVDSVDITITDSTVNSVYGGGDLGHVVNNTNIELINSTAQTVYGGSDGSTAIAGVTLYQPCDDMTTDENGNQVYDYMGPRPDYIEATGEYEYNHNYATRRDGTTRYEFESLGTYTWVGGDIPAIDHAAKTVTTTEMAKAGVVGGNTHVTIGGTSIVTGAVYGGGKAGVVKGNTQVDIQSGTFGSGVSVYGGGMSASVASTQVNIAGGTFGGGSEDLNNGIFGGGSAGEVIGAASINVTGGTFKGATIYGGGRSASVASATTNVTAGDFTTADGRIFGGGYEGKVTGQATLNISQLSGTLSYLLYGGGSGATVNSVAMSITNIASQKNIYGGGYAAGATVLEDVSLTATNLTHGTGYNNDGKPKSTIYGGGYSAAVNGTVTMNLHNGFYDWIYGGGFKGTCQDVIINLTGDREATDPSPSTNGGVTKVMQPVVNWCLRGGGDAGDCKDVTVNMWSGSICRNIHTAGANCTVNSTTFNMYGGMTRNIFGGGDWGAVKTNTQVNLYGGSVGTIYGGSDRPSSRVGGSGVLVDDNADSTAALTVRGDIYGGCDQGLVMPRETTNTQLVGNSKVYTFGTGTSIVFSGTGCTQVEIKSGDARAVFGGSNGAQDGEATEPSGNANFGSVLGTDTDGYSSKVLISGGVVSGAVYGGNYTAGQLEGNTLVQISGGAVRNYVYGGNLGDSAKNAVGANIHGTAKVIITGGTVGKNGNTSYLIFGGNKSLGTVGATSVQISGMAELGASSVYGGNHAGGTVTGTAAVTVANSTVTYLFGGNYANGTVGESQVIIDGSSFNSAYGGNENGGSVDGQAELIIRNASTVVNGAYGGNFNGGTVESTQLTFNNSTSINTNYGLYGGNNNGGTVTGDANVAIQSGLYLRVFGGNKADGNINGSTYVHIGRGVDGSGDSPYIYGGNNAGGMVSGNSNVTMDFSEGHVTCVFGGNYSSGTVAGKAIITMRQGYLWYLLVGGNQAGGTVGTPGNANSGVEIVITNDNLYKKIATPYGGNYRGGVIYGDVNVTIDGGAAGTLVEYYAFGGNCEDGTINGNVTFTVASSNVDIIRDANEGDAFRGVYGGNYQGGLITGNVTVNLLGSKDEIPVLCGGSYNGGIINGLATTNMSGGTVTNVYGGNNNGGHIGTVGNANTGVAVNMTGGTVTQRLFGGSNESGTIAGQINVTMTGGEVTKDLSGGGYKADVTADVTALNVTIGGDAQIPGWLYAGGFNADCALAPNLTIMGNCTIQFACGGSNAGDVLGTNVVVTGCQSVGALFGGSNAGAGSVTGNTSVKMSGGTISSIRGGGNYAVTSGNTYVEMSGGTVISRINGAGNKSIVQGSATVLMTGGTIGNIFGGADSGKSSNGNPERAYLYGDATITVTEGATVNDSIYGAGNNEWATSYGDAFIQISGGTIGGSVYGGGNLGLMEIDAQKNPDGGDTSITITEGTIGGSVYGGGKNAAVPGNTNLNLTGGTIRRSFFGGGEQGVVEGDVTITVTGGSYGTATQRATVYSSYGGGKAADVNGNVTITVSDGVFSGILYGGGSDGDIVGNVTMDISGGSFADCIYGGGQNGTVDSTHVVIRESANILGSVYGGGEGATATVFDGTYVEVDLIFGFQVDENPISTTNITPSGMTHSTLAINPLPEQGMIAGSVYGGGNMGRVGDGTITVGGDKAYISTEASTKVLIKSGCIQGNVFGGGNGEPKNITYTPYLGTVFGSTEVEIQGGLIGIMENGVTSGGNVFGGGEQSRVYAAEGKNATKVSILETVDSISGGTTTYKKIAICGSVFGGGDRGNSATANASIPTVYGDVDVLIQGIADHAPSDIYFLGGGVYGDGNLCLVRGYRRIELENFEPSTSGDLVKTFYSLQRADEAILDNSAVVLLGAADLVEEGDTNLYSINRITKLKMENGSVMKLDQIVKYMGGISSDVHATQKFIHDGTNGRTKSYWDYTSCTCREVGTEEHTCDDCLEPLTQELVDAYLDETGNHDAEDKNVVCVANGLYLEVINEENQYGPVTGLFTLQLLYANPGEGGGFVYGSIPESTGDFICETHSWVFNAQTVTSQAEYDDLMKEQNDEVFVRVAGKAFQRATGYVSGTTYYTRTNTNEYMEIIDDVGGATGSGYTYYYWYIGGPSVTYNVSITGYIGAANTEFVSTTTLPQHSTPRAYVLYGVDVNAAFANAVADGGDYVLTNSKNVSGKQIAVELRLGDQSLGFLVKTGNGWGIQRSDSSVIGGYAGSAQAAPNHILHITDVTAANDQLSWVLHKATTVDSTTEEPLEVYLDIDLFESDGERLTAVTTGTSMLAYTTQLEIARITATQALYYDNNRSYTGVAVSSAIHITGNSSFTAEFQTRYVPAAYPMAGGMTWALSTQSYTYYMVSGLGSYFTLDGNGNCVNASEGVVFAELTKLADGTYKDSENNIYAVRQAYSANAIPKNTKITMVDLTGGTAQYYYYICESDTPSIDLTRFMQMGTDTTIASMTQKPTFLTAYNGQQMDIVTERLIFILDFEQANLPDGIYTGGLSLQHIHDEVDIMDYVKDDATGSPVRYAPKAMEYQVAKNETGVVGDTYTAAFKSAAYDDQGNAAMTIHVEESENWINTIFRENGFAFKIQLVDDSGNPLPMPPGMYITYKGQDYYPGMDSTFISVPVREFGDHELVIHNPSFSLASATGSNTANFRIGYYSAPDANYYNAFNTGVVDEASFTIITTPVYSLKVEGAPVQKRILSGGEELKFTYSTLNTGDVAQEVKVTLWKKDASGEYKTANWGEVFTDAPQTMAEGTASCSWELQGAAASGTYRMIFTYADHTEYMNFIVE